VCRVYKSELNPGNCTTLPVRITHLFPEVRKTRQPTDSLDDPASILPDYRDIVVSQILSSGRPIQQAERSGVRSESMEGFRVKNVSHELIQTKSDRNFLVVFTIKGESVLQRLAQSSDIDLNGGRPSFKPAMAQQVKIPEHAEVGFDTDEDGRPVRVLSEW
jgi:hypothetical protein